MRPNWCFFSLLRAIPTTRFQQSAHFSRYDPPPFHPFPERAAVLLRPPTTQNHLSIVFFRPQPLILAHTLSLSLFFSWSHDDDNDDNESLSCVSAVRSSRARCVADRTIALCNDGAPLETRSCIDGSRRPTAAFFPPTDSMKEISPQFTSTLHLNPPPCLLVPHPFFQLCAMIRSCPLVAHTL